MKIFLFRLPNAIARVRAADVREARAILRRTCYVGAPVGTWPEVTE